MKQKSSYVRPRPPSPAMGTYVSRARETATNPRSTGPREAAATPLDLTLMDMRTDLTAVPHAGLGYHFLRVQVREPEKEVEVQQVQRGHKGKRNHRTIDRQNDVVRSHLQVKTKALCVTAESKSVQRPESCCS